MKIAQVAPLIERVLLVSMAAPSGAFIDGHRADQMRDCAKDLDVIASFVG